MDSVPISITQRGQARPSAPPDAGQGGLHLDRLKALWKLSTQRDMDDGERIRAMLGLVAEVLVMDLVVLGEFERDYTARYAYDRLGLVPEGLVMQMQDTLCTDVYRSRAAVHIPDLTQHPDFFRHPMATTAGMRLYSGIPVRTGEEVRWVLAFLRQQAEPQIQEADVAYMELVADWLGNALHQSAQKDLLKQWALTDPLTGLPNRRAAEERLVQEFARAQRHDASFALAVMDLDHFKLINDRYGHATGDEVLNVLAQRLQAELREGDWVARWGGEEFLFYLHDSSAPEAVCAMERLASHVKSNPIPTAVGAIPLTMSAGIGVQGKGQYDLQNALGMADAALYQAKSLGRDRIHTAAAGANSAWSGHGLKDALRDGRVRMAAQVIVDLQTGQPVADETLARMVTVHGEILEATDFIDRAEGLGIVAEIDRHMTRLTMDRCTARLREGSHAPEFVHFVNLSPQFLARRDLVEEMLRNAQSCCASSGVTTGATTVKPIVLEITERQHIGNLAALREDLQPILDFGFRLALDDFGSGYSSFLYLAHLPVSFLKIEGWLVGNMRRERKIAAMVESMANFARKEGIQTVAEHIEDAETARILREMGVDWGQGWFFGRPQLE
jgi:diguanylate cyclase